MLDIFERHTKPKFDATSQRLYIKFGSSRDEDSASEIHRGQLSLDVYAMITLSLILHTEVHRLAPT